MSASPVSRLVSPEHLGEVPRKADLLYTPDEIEQAYDRIAAAITRTLARTPAKKNDPHEPYAKVRIVPTSKAKTGEEAEFTLRD